jgi:hypothetical protein
MLDNFLCKKLNIFLTFALLWTQRLWISIGDCILFLDLTGRPKFQHQSLFPQNMVLPAGFQKSLRTFCIGILKVN